MDDSFPSRFCKLHGLQQSHLAAVTHAPILPFPKTFMMILVVPQVQFPGTIGAKIPDKLYLNENMMWYEYGA